MNEAERMLLADAVECCIDYERKVIRLKRCIIALGVVCMILGAGYFFI